MENEDTGGSKGNNALADLDSDRLEVIKECPDEVKSSSEAVQTS